MFAIPLSAIALAVFTHTLWGGNPVAIKLGLEWLPPFWTGFIRFILGTITVILYAKWRRIRIWPGRHEWPPLIILSVLFGLQITVMNIGYDMTSGSVGAVILSSYPLFAALCAHYFLTGDKLRPMKSAGLIVAFGGVGLILLRELDFSADGFLGLGPLIVLISAMMLGSRVIFAAHMVQSIEPVKAVIWQMVLSLPYFLLGGLIFEEIQWQNVSTGSVLGILYQGIIIAGFGFVVTMTLPKYFSASLVTSFGFVSPISGVLIAVWLLGDALTWQLVVGTATVGLGLYLIARKPTHTA